ncbi:MAG: hypothetical protein EF806_02820 [Candidatus Methanoliparum thermophilum]|uniref:Uncharacterized protein n=1 Tax=Methanoliparum thermophilum TaxID=2491083 RepID=A0A520KT68_METT2|nr:MAG: hypothetical protein EF806_02820 [Candidatus Methanoliparum thermophilum]
MGESTTTQNLTAAL